MCFLAKCQVKITTGESPLCWPTSCFIALVKLSIVPSHERKLSCSFIFRPLRELDHSRLISVKLFVCVLFLFNLEQHSSLYTSRIIPARRKCVCSVEGLKVLSVQVVKDGSQSGPWGCPRD